MYFSAFRWVGLSALLLMMKVFKQLEGTDAVHSILSQISFLGGITDAQQAIIFKYFETATFEPGEVIAHHGEEPSRLYIIRSGRVELRITLGERVVRKREFGVGDCFGEAAMLSLINNTATFIAAEPCELITLSRKSLYRLRSDDRDVFCQLMLNLARDLARKLQYSDELLLRHEGI